MGGGKRFYRNLLKIKDIYKKLVKTFDNTQKNKGEIMKGFSDIFEGRITKSYRFLCLIKNDVITLLRCGKHDDFF